MKSGRGAPRGALRAVAVVVLLAVAGAASGGLGGTAVAGTQGPVSDIEALSALLAAAAAAPERRADIDGCVRALSMAVRAGHLDVQSAFSSVFPRAESVMAMLALDRDVDDFEEMGAGHTAAAAHYRKAAELARALRPLRDNYSTLYSSACRELRMASQAWPKLNADADRAQDSAPGLPAVLDVRNLAARGELEAPPLRDLAYSHPYALDIFFRHVDRRGAVEYGPLIAALEGGIVVAAAQDWRGGAGASAWAGGGLSPSAGNGVVVYSPGSGRYYSYFHFSEVAVRRGQVVAAGEVIGRGGNSGANARKPGHGGHLHLEIFDEATGRALSAWRIRELLFGADRG
jgi:hypothetical protein